MLEQETQVKKAGGIFFQCIAHKPTASGTGHHTPQGSAPGKDRSSGTRTAEGRAKGRLRAASKGRTARKVSLSARAG